MPGHIAARHGRCGIGESGAFRKNISSIQYKGRRGRAALHVVHSLEEFQQQAKAHNLVPVWSRITSDNLTPVSVYRALAGPDVDGAPSYLFESVQNGTDTGRYSFVGARPALEVLAKGKQVTILDHTHGERSISTEQDPLSVPVDISRTWKPFRCPQIPDVFTGGWVGYTGYDTVRYTYPKKIGFDGAAEDDRDLLDMHLALYKDTVVFDNATKLLYIICWLEVSEQDDTEALYNAGRRKVSTIERGLMRGGAGPAAATVAMDLTAAPKRPSQSNTSEAEYLGAVEAVKEHIRAGDAFQVVLSQRFERSTYVDPFDIYRALRIVNPSPYMAYLKARSCILVAASPEILCRVDDEGVITNRPLAGTRRRGADAAEDASLQADMLSDEKEVAEHIMLVDLGRNDVGRVAVPGSVKVQKLMDIERYSHVMHISSTVKGKLKPGLDAWDALRAALPVGTVSGAPKVRAMQIIDDLEKNRRGPYGGGYGHVSFTGRMDIALALRTMVIPTNTHDELYEHGSDSRQWRVHIQAGAGIVADSDPQAEYEECVNKAKALNRAVDLAESFGETCL